MPSRFLLDILLFRLNWLAPQSCRFHTFTAGIRHNPTLVAPVPGVPERQELPELDGKTPKMSPAEVASFPDAFSGVEVRHDSCNSKVPRWEDLPGYPFCAPLEVDGPCVFACFGKAQAVPQRYATSPPLCCINALQGKCAQVWHQPCPFVGTVLSQREEMGKFDQVRFVGSHSLSKALGPWLAAEIPYLIETGVVTHKGLVA